MSVAGGDFNGDAATDLVVGAPQFATGTHGYAGIYFGGEEQEIRLTLTPRGDPIVIPPDGGTFQFRLTLINLSSETRTIHIRVRLTGPGTQRALARFSETLDPGKSFKQAFTTRVPGRAQPGAYTVTGTASLSNKAEGMDSFELQKSAQ
jgi:hypothetical protein